MKNIALVTCCLIFNIIYSNPMITYLNSPKKNPQACDIFDIKESQLDELFMQLSQHLQDLTFTNLEDVNIRLNVHDFTRTTRLTQITKSKEDPILTQTNNQSNNSPKTTAATTPVRTPEEILKDITNLIERNRPYAKTDILGNSTPPTESAINSFNSINAVYKEYVQKLTYHPSESFDENLKGLKGFIINLKNLSFLVIPNNGYWEEFEKNNSSTDHRSRTIDFLTISSYDTNYAKQKNILNKLHLFALENAKKAAQALMKVKFFFEEEAKTENTYNKIKNFLMYKITSHSEESYLECKFYPSIQLILQDLYTIQTTIYTTVYKEQIEEAQEKSAFYAKQINDLSENLTQQYKNIPYTYPTNKLTQEELQNIFTTIDNLWKTYQTLKTNLSSFINDNKFITKNFEEKSIRLCNLYEQQNLFETQQGIKAKFEYCITRALHAEYIEQMDITLITTWISFLKIFKSKINSYTTQEIPIITTLRNYRQELKQEYIFPSQRLDYYEMILNQNLEQQKAVIIKKQIDEIRRSNLGTTLEIAKTIDPLLDYCNKLYAIMQNSLSTALRKECAKVITDALDPSFVQPTKPAEKNYLMWLLLRMEQHSMTYYKKNEFETFKSLVTYIKDKYENILKQKSIFVSSAKLILTNQTEQDISKKFTSIIEDKINRCQNAINKAEAVASNTRTKTDSALEEKPLTKDAK